MSIFHRIFLLSRPRFWHYLAGPWSIGVLLGILNGAQSIDLPVLIFWGLWWLLPANLFLYGINDVFDYETDLLNPKKQGKELLLPTSWHRGLLWYVFFFCLLSLTFSSTRTEIFFAQFAFVFLGAFYSMPPIRFKARPFLDMLSNFLYIVPGLHGYFLVGQQAFDPLLFLAGGLWCMAMHAFSAIPDIDYDKKASIATTATVLGSSKTLLLCALLYGSASIFVASYSALVSLGALGYALLCLWLRATNLSRGRLRQIYWLFPWFNLTFGALITLTVLWRFVV